MIRSRLDPTARIRDDMHVARPSPQMRGVHAVGRMDTQTPDHRAESNLEPALLATVRVPLFSRGLRPQTSR